MCFCLHCLHAVAVQLRAEYIGVMSRVLSGHFKTYLAALEKMEAAVAGEPMQPYSYAAVEMWLSLRCCERREIDAGAVKNG